MNKKLALAIFLMLAIGLSCHKKNDDGPVPLITGSALMIKELIAPGDNFISPLPFPSVLTLHSDHSWNLQIGNEQTSGKFTWQSFTSTSGTIKFTIRQWSSSATKLKAVIEAINKCEFPEVPPNSDVLFSVDGGSGYMKTSR